MSQNKDDKGTPPRPGADASLPKRPVPTIDLKATEIKVETKPAATSAATAATPSSATSPPGAAASADPKSRANPTSAASARPASSVPPTGTASSASSAASSATTATATTSASRSTGGTAPMTAVAANNGTASGSGIGRALSYLGAALLGGLLALFSGDFLSTTFGLDLRQGGTPAPVVEDLTARLKKLEQTASQAPAARIDAAAVKGVSDQLVQANERIAKLEGANRQLAALSEAQTKLVETTQGLETKLGQSLATPDASGRISRLEETLQSLAAVAQAQPGQPLPEFARLNAKLGEIETAVAALRRGGTNDARAQIEARLAEARKAEVQIGEAVTALKEVNTKRLRELEAVKTETARLEQRVEAVRTDAGTARSSVDALKSDVASQLQTMARQGDLKTSFEGVDKRVAGIETRIETMAKRDDERQASSERIVVSLQLANLKRQMEQGKPYAEALAEVEKVAGGLAELAPLKTHRDKGVLPTPELLAEFRKVTRAVLEAEQDPGQSSTVNRLLQSAKSVVQIRRTGDVQGDTAEAVLARAETHMKAGDLVTASKEMKSLKPELRGAAQGWLDQLEARVAVDRALKAIEDKLKTSIAGARAAAPAAAPAAPKGGSRP